MSKRNSHIPIGEGYQARILRCRRSCLLAIAQKHGIGRLRVFGSLARDEFRATSDIDLLVDLKPGQTLLGLVAFRREAEEILATPIDVATADMLKEHIRSKVLTEALPL